LLLHEAYGLSKSVTTRLTVWRPASRKGLMTRFADCVLPKNVLPLHVFVYVQCATKPSASSVFDCGHATRITSTHYQ